MQKKYVNIKEVSDYTSIPTRTLYDWAAQGVFPSIKIGRRVLFDLDDIDMAMAKLKRDLGTGDKTANKIIRELQDNEI